MTWLGEHAHQAHWASREQRARVFENAFVIVAAAIAYALTLALNALAARILPQVAYGEFSSAVAMVTLTCTFATLGLEKYALRLLPEYLHTDRANKAKGYVIFGVAVSVAVGIAVALGGFHLYKHFKPHAEGVEVLGRLVRFVPSIALFLFLLEVATTFRSAIGSTLIYRMVLPGMTLAAMAVAPHWFAPFTANDAVAIYGYSWEAALVVMALYVFVVAPRSLREARVSMEPRLWLVEGMEFLGMSLLMTVFSQSALLILEVFRGDRVGVAHLSACMQIAGLAIILQTATMRIFGPQLSQMIAQGDLEAQMRLARRRMLLMSVLGGAFLGTIILFGHSLLELFGPDYTDAYPTLVVLAVGNVLNIVFGGSATYLQFHGLHRTALGIASTGTLLAVVAVTIGALLGDYATVAKAYVAVLIAMYATFEITARVHLARAIRRSATSTRS